MLVKVEISLYSALSGLLLSTAGVEATAGIVHTPEDVFWSAVQGGGLAAMVTGSAMFSTKDQRLTNPQIGVKAATTMAAGVIAAVNLGPFIHYKYLLPRVEGLGLGVSVFVIAIIAEKVLSAVLTSDLKDWWAIIKDRVGKLFS